MLQKSLIQSNIPGNREPVMVNTEKQHKKHTKQKSRDCSSEKRCRYRRHIHCGSSFIRRNNSKRNRKNQSNDLCQNGKTDRGTKIFGNGLKYRLLKKIRSPPVPMKYIHEPVCILHQKRAVKTKFCIQRRNLIRACLQPQKRRCRASRNQICYQKDNHRYNEHDRNQGQDTFPNVF